MIASRSVWFSACLVMTLGIVHAQQGQKAQKTAASTPAPVSAPVPTPATPAPAPNPASSPKTAPGKSIQEDLEADASRLLNDLPALTDPENAPPADGQKFTVAEAKTRLARTQQKLQKWEKLFREGVLSQSEVERCTVELADALARYEH